MNDAQLRTTLARQLRRSQAHAGLTAALAGFPADRAGHALEGHPHTAWQQVEHMRLAAEDLVAYCRDSEYRALTFPGGYWPEDPAPPSEEAFSASAQGLRDATEQMAQLIESTEIDLRAPVPTAEKPHHHTLRAALILLDHNGYHAGQLIALRQALNAWSPG